MRRRAEVFDRRVGCIEDAGNDDDQSDNNVMRLMIDKMACRIQRVSILFRAESGIKKGWRHAVLRDVFKQVLITKLVVTVTE